MVDCEGEVNEGIGGVVVCKEGQNFFGLPAALSLAILQSERLSLR